MNRLPVTPVLLTPEQQLARADTWIAAYQECVVIARRKRRLDLAEVYARARDAELDYRLTLTA